MKNCLFSALALSVLVFTSCGDDDTNEDNGIDAGFLASNLDDLGDIDLDGFDIPETYDIEGVFAPGAYNGQKRRIAQLEQIKDVTRDQPITWELDSAIVIGSTYELFTGTAAEGADLQTKIDELNFDEGFTGIADDFVALATLLEESSQTNTGDASNGTAGVADDRHFSANGLEYAQILEKGLYGALLYDQMVDDYLRLSQAGADNAAGNNQAGTDNYAEYGTDRQHRWDEAFGYLGADPDTYPNAASTSDGDGVFIANYTFDFSDETESAYGINMAQKLMNAFIVGRAALKAGEGLTETDEVEYTDVFNAARADAKLYTEAGIAAAAFHYLNAAIEDVTDVDKLHHLSEAIAFIYALSFNSEGLLSLTDARGALGALGWSTQLDTGSGMIQLDELYDVNLYEVTDTQMQAAKDILNGAYPGFNDVAF